MGFFDHSHYWVLVRTNPVSTDKPGQHIAEIITYRCGCGRIRYDKVGGDGLISTQVTDPEGKVIKD